MWIRAWEGVALWMGCDGVTCGSEVREIVEHVDQSLERGGTCGLGSLRMWHLWIRVCEDVALVDGSVRAWHLWIMFCEGVALKVWHLWMSLKRSGTRGSCSGRVWHLLIRVWEGVALIIKGL